MKYFILLLGTNHPTYFVTRLGIEYVPSSKALGAFGDSSSVNNDSSSSGTKNEIDSV